MKRILIVVLSFFAAACATQRDQRDAARLLSLHTKAVQADLERFAEKRAVANQARQRTINALEVSRLKRERQNEEKLRVWKISDKARETLFNEVVAATTAVTARATEAEAEIRANEAALANMKSSVLTRSDQLTKSSKTLVRLSERDSLRTQLKFYQSFWDDVQKSVADAAAAAEKDAQAALPKGSSK